MTVYKARHHQQVGSAQVRRRRFNIGCCPRPDGYDTTVIDDEIGISVLRSAGVTSYDPYIPKHLIRSAVAHCDGT